MCIRELLTVAHVVAGALHVLQGRIHVHSGELFEFSSVIFFGIAILLSKQMHDIRTALILWIFEQIAPLVRFQSGEEHEGEHDEEEHSKANDHLASVPFLGAYFQILPDDVGWLGGSLHLGLLVEEPQCIMIFVSLSFFISPEEVLPTPLKCFLRRKSNECAHRLLQLLFLILYKLVYFSIRFNYLLELGLTNQTTSLCQ